MRIRSPYARSSRSANYGRRVDTRVGVDHLLDVNRAPVNPKRFLFGDPRRTRSLGLGCVTAIASYPVYWFILLFVVALGGGAGSDATDSENQSLAQSIVWLAAGFVMLAVVVVAFSWVTARRSYAPESRASPWSLETGLWAVAIMVMLALASWFGVFAWNLDYVGDDSSF
jgi:hypothetical protein